MALARVARQRDAATAKYLRDRDVAALEATMARLDAEEHEARQERVVDGVPPTEAVRYLRELQPTWEAADGGSGRQMLAEALFERIDVRGFREVRLHLTDAAIAHGFGAVLPESFGISVNGRGERGSASLTHLSARPRIRARERDPAVEGVAGRPPAGRLKPRRQPTRRQLAVLRCLHRRRTGGRRRLRARLTETTVRQHLSGLYRRTRVRNAAQAAYYLADLLGPTRGPVARSAGPTSFPAR